MKLLILMAYFTSAACAQVSTSFHKCVYDACRSREELVLVSTKSGFEITSNFTVLSFQSAFDRMDAADRKMRISLRDSKIDHDLALKIRQGIAGKYKLRYLNPTRIIAGVLIIQRDSPKSVKEVCDDYEKAIAELERSGHSGRELELLQLLKQEAYPCIFYIDNEIMWKNMTILKFLEKLREDAGSVKPPEK